MSSHPAAPPPAPIGTLGVPDTARGFLFDLDGVLTQTAKQHRTAWKLMFDDFLTQRVKDTSEVFVPFDSGADYGLSNRKNALVLELIDTEGVAVYPGSVRYVHAARGAGLPCAVVTSSANAEQVLASAGLSELFDARIDGLIAVDRVGQADALRAHGADLVVDDLAELQDRS